MLQTIEAIALVKIRLPNHMEMERTELRRYPGPAVLALRCRPASGGGPGQEANDYPPMQDPASINLDKVKKQIEDTNMAHHGQ